MNNSLQPFPNWIFLPKIVPLVYDDTLSYYEFLNKVLVKLNEVIDFANDLNLEVNELKTAVETLQTLVNGFDTRITANETAISNLQSTVNTINSTIETINTAITNLQTAISTEEANRIAGDNAVRSDFTAALNSYASTINGEIATLTDQVNEIVPTLASYDARITALEEATIGTLTPTTVSRLFTADFRNLDMVDYEIIDDVEGGTNPSILIAENKGGWSTSPALSSSFTMLQFKNSGDQTRLVIKNVLPYLYNGNTDTNTGNSGFKCYAITWNGTGVQYLDRNALVTIKQAKAGIEGASTTSNHGLFRNYQLVLNDQTGYFDLHIYNGKNSQFVTTNNIALAYFVIVDSDLLSDPQIYQMIPAWGKAVSALSKREAAAISASDRAYSDSNLVLAKAYADDVSATAKTDAVSDAGDYTDDKIATFVDALNPELYQVNSYQLQGQDTTSGGASSTMADVFVFDSGVTHNVYKNTRILEASGTDYADTSVTPNEYFINPRILMMYMSISASDLTFNSQTWTKVCEIDLEELFDIPDDSYVRPVAGRELALTGTQYISASMSSNNPIEARVVKNGDAVEVQVRYFGENRSNIQTFINGLVVFDYVNS